jgi:hypothetical protein
VSQIAPPNKLQEMLDSGIITEEQYKNFVGSMNGGGKVETTTMRRPTTSVRGMRSNIGGTPAKAPSKGKAKRAIVALAIIGAGAAGYYLYSHNKSSKAAAAVTIRGSAARLHCLADARSVARAVHAYDVAHARTPITGETVSIAPMGDAIDPGVPSTYGDGSQSQRLVHSGLISSWPKSGGGYAIALSTYFQAGQGGAHLGEPVIYVPATSTHGVSLSHEGTRAGCYAL